MKLFGYSVYVAEALDRLGPCNQTTLTEAVWGISGRNAAPLVSLLNWMVSVNTIERRQHGRTKIYSLPKERTETHARLIHEGRELLKERNDTIARLVAPRN